MGHIETDYLVIGAGATGMAFTDSLMTESDAEVVMVDRRDRPGGHWNDAYPFVRLHQPAAFYGVNSRRLGTDSVDVDGPNAGLYEQSSAPEIVGYFGEVLRDELLASGRVRFFGMSDYRGEDGDAHRFVSLVTGEETTVSVRRRLVDARYQEAEIPSTHEPPYRIAAGVHHVPVNALTTIEDPPSQFVLIGAGKTAMDACAWLLRHGTDPDRIVWVRPRDSWLYNRELTQPLDQVASIIDAASLDLEACARAENVDDVFRSLEASDRLFRLDPNVWPTMFRCATVSRAELDELRVVTDVVRMGRVKAIEADEMTLEDGRLATSTSALHVDCTAGGLRTSATRPIFQPGRITVQQVRTCQPTFNAALIAYIEATRDDDDEKNELCPPNRYPDASIDYLRGVLVQQRATNAWTAHGDIVAWLGRSRLDAAGAMREHMDEPRMQEAVTRMLESSEPAIENLERLLGAHDADGKG